MAKKLTETEQKELKELIAKRKSNKLSEADQARLDELNAKCGFKGKGGKGKDGPKAFVPGNDFSWWSKCPELLKDAANYKCNYVAGTEIGDPDVPYIVPGVLVVGVSPSYGKNFKATDPINVWARDLYLQMFQKYRVANNYSMSDLGITLIAEIELVKMVAYYERVYGILNRYSKLNVNMPYTELLALGISEDTSDWLRKHLSDFRYDLNVLIDRMQRISIMQDISLISNAISLFGYEYLDHDSVKSQVILFTPTHYGIYDETDMSSGNVKFEPFSIGDDLFRLSESDDDNICVVLENMIDALLGSDSIQKIVADLVVWFGEETMLHFNHVPDDYMIVPAYSESILHKLHNAESFCVGSALVSLVHTGLSAEDKTALQNSYRIYQHNDRIITAFGAVDTQGNRSLISVPGFGGYFQIAGGVNQQYYALSKGHVLDTYRADLNEETVTEGVLFKYNAQFAKANVGNTPYYATVVNVCNFEIIRSFKLFNANGEVVNDVVGNVNDDPSEGRGFAAEMAVIDWAPLSYHADDTELGIINRIFGDMDNIICMPVDGLAKLSRSIQYSGLKTTAQVKK